jgi:uncharacterized protein YcfJ
MKKVMLVALAAMFSISMFAQTQDKAKPAEKKAEPAKTEAVKPAKETAKPATKETAKPATKEAAKPAKKTEEAKPAK